MRDYGLERAEGLLLRYLNSAYDVLAHTVPSVFKTQAVLEIESSLGAMIRQIDSSLLDTWERMRDPNYRAAEPHEVKPAGAQAADITRDAASFTAMIRTRIFTFLRALAARRIEAALASLDDRLPDPAHPAPSAWTPQRLGEALDRFTQSHAALLLDAEARNLRHTYVQTASDKKHWRVQQMLRDTEELHDWAAEFDVDLAASAETGEPVLTLVRIGELIDSGSGE